MNSKSFFNVKNAGLFLLVSLILLSFTNPNKHFSKQNLKDVKKKFHKNFDYSESEGLIKALPPGSIRNKRGNIGTAFPISPDRSSKSLKFAESLTGYKSSDRHEGTIGSLDSENWNDDPADNIYNIYLAQYNAGRQYTLVYRVYGLANSASVTRSINKSFALGGYVVSKKEGWTTITENIDPSLLKRGNNQILFNTNSKDFYKVKDVEIIERSNVAKTLYQVTSYFSNGNTVYVKGFFSKDSDIVQVQISGRKATVTGNEFEFFGEDMVFGINQTVEYTKKDGSILRENLPKTSSDQGVPADIFNRPEEKIIVKNQSWSLLGLRQVDLPPVDAAITNVNKDFYGYRLKNSVDGIMTIHLPFDKDKIPKGYNESDISTFYFDYSAKKWQRVTIDKIDTDEESIVLTVDGKGGNTDYVNGIIKNPETPETSSFAPTATNDVPVADPTSKINMISPPIPNQQGSANVSYPIEIPAGINGFQPNISVNYNSDVKNGGWLGVGWDIPMETIEIDTRWGVPAFDPIKESEIYTINGEQLVFDDSFLPNKTPSNLWKDRLSGDKNFYFRIGVKEGTKIIRKGQTTKDYTWEITDNDGNVKRYNTVLKDAAGNNVRWFLTNVTNKYNQQITYLYEELTYDAGGKNKYLKEISYSANNTKIEFTNQDSSRPDVTSSYKLGVKISEFKILHKIVVKRASSIVRQYRFAYTRGNFEKTLLQKIIQLDGAGKEFNQHVFDYTIIDEKGNGPGTWCGEETDESLFSKYPRIITSPSDNLTSGNYDGAKMSLISGTQGESENFKGALSIGYGFGISGNKKRTGGLNYTYAENKNFGKLQLMDIDGDGMPDKVFFRDSGAIQYRKNNGDSFSNTLSQISGLDGVPLSRNNAYVNSFGVELSFKILQGGLTYSVTKGNNPVYFSDVNGDGLPDLLYYGKSYFGKYKLLNNTPYIHYSAIKDDASALSDTPNAILKGINAPQTINPEEASNLLANIVKVWEAPNSGVINISNQISLEQNSQDGVDVWMEMGSLSRANENIPNIPPSSPIGAKVTLNNNGEQRSLNANNISVNKGQRIYIIASSKQNAKGDRIKIQTDIQYNSVLGFNPADINSKDTNGDDFFKFNAEKSFLKTTSKGNGIHEKGIAKISWPKGDALKFSDDIQFKIYKLEKKLLDTTDLVYTDQPTIIFHQKLKKGETLDKLSADENTIAGVNIEQLMMNSNSTEQSPSMTFLYFEVSADTNIAWDKIDWKPTLSVPLDGEMQNHNMVVQYRPFVEKIKLQSAPIRNDFGLRSNQRWYPKFTSCYDNSLHIPVNGANNSEVTFSIKFTNYTVDNVTYYPTYILKKKVKIINNLMEIPYLDNYHDNPRFDQALFEIHTTNYDVGAFLAQMNPTIEAIQQNCFTIQTAIKPNYFSSRSQSKHYNPIIGSMWQSWGEFSYNGSKFSNQPLKEQEFIISPLDDNNFPMPGCGDPSSPGYDSCMVNYVNAQQNSRYFTPLELDVITNGYVSPMEATFIDKNYMQPYNLLARKPSETFEHDPTFVTDDPVGIISHSKGTSLNIYGSLLSANANGGWSKDETSEYFQDFNGDGYPDIIIEDKYYKTTMAGELTDYAPIGNKTIRNNTKNSNVGFSFGKSIYPEKNSNTQTTGANSWGELKSQMGSSFAASGGNVGVTIGKSNSRNTNIWFDINGDGLVDYISDSQVFINNGKDFVFESGWNIGDDVFNNTTEAVSGGGGINLGNGSWVLGVGKNFSFSKNNTFFIDVTGDGLVDKLKKNGNKYDMYVNMGDRFSSSPVTIGTTFDIEIENKQNTAGLNAAGTGCVAFGVKVCLSLGYGNDRSTNKQTVDLRDFNGDGLPDVLISENETQMTVIDNQADQFNLLKSIENPLGGMMYFTYKNRSLITQNKIGNTYQMPTTKRAFVKLDIDDLESTYNISEYKADLNPNYKKYYFEYENGVQDRRERTFLGFGKVSTRDKSGITHVTEYETNFTNANDFYVPYNKSSVRKYFYKKGLVKSTYTLDSIGRQRQRVNYTYRYFNNTSENGYVLTENQTEPDFQDMGRILPFLYKTESVTTEYSGTTSHSKTLVSTVDEYDKYGNVAKYTDWGANISSSSDDLKISISYHPIILAKNIFGVPQQHTVSNNLGTIFRKSETEINDKGDVTIIKRYFGNNFAEFKYQYDTFGNITKVVLPKNQGQSESDRMFYKYDYDATYNTYITKITDARGLSSSTVYDNNFLFGIPIAMTDANNAVAYYTYDSFGRLTEYRSPVDLNWTIRLNYFKADEHNSKVALTEKRAPIVNGVSSTLNYFSSVQVNGWGEEMATKKLFGGTTNNYVYTYTKSPIKDFKGRVLKSFANKLATQEQGTILDVMQKFSPLPYERLNDNEFINNFVSYQYDELDRPTKTIQKGVLTNSGIKNLITETQYGFDSDRDGEIQFTQKTISPRGLINIKYTDAKGRTKATKQMGDNKSLWTSYFYNPINELVEVKDQNSVSTHYEYDQLGRRVSQNHPDAGLSSYEYNENGNLIYRSNPVLRGLGEKIAYEYKFNRLTKIIYPNYEVNYEYGEANAPDFAAGRITKITDHSGVQMFKYNKLGQLTEDKRFIAAPNVPAKVFKTSFVYDAFNRINKITYPDTEEVYYAYNPFGLLDKITTKSPGTTVTSPIVSSISYDYNEQMTEIVAGNGTKTQYQYDVWGRLGELALKASDMTQIKKNNYLFDADGNVKSITASVPMTGVSPTGEISFDSERTFDYDGFNRLKNSVIKTIGKNEKTYYSLEMDYTDMHGIANKKSRWKNYQVGVCENPPPQGSDGVYAYEDRDHPNAVSSITFNSVSNFSTPWDCRTGIDLVNNSIIEKYSYDANGNMISVSEGGIDAGPTTSEQNIKRQLFWDSENRMKGIAEQNALHHYVYDASGERVLKSEGAMRAIKVDGNVKSKPGPTIMGAYSYYPNGYIVANDRQLSKHYYIGANKIASRVGATPAHGFAAAANTELQNISDLLQNEADLLAEEANLPSILWPNKILGDVLYMDEEQRCSDEILKQVEMFSETGNRNCAKILMSGYDDALLTGRICDFWQNFKLDDCMINQPVEEQRYQTYWLHPDHLGSSSVITNQFGATTNWYEYMPFGEILAERGNNEYNNPFKYNGKELDEATQLYYYGARYYDPKTSIWLSVDPLAEVTPSWSPYAYALNNPVRYIDPTGMIAKPPKDSGGFENGHIWTDSDGTWERMDGGWKSKTEGQESIIDEVVVTGKKNGVSASFASAYSKNNKSGFHLLSAGYNNYGKYGAFESNVKLFSGELTNYTFTGSLPMALDVDAKASVASAKVGGRLGTKNFNLYGEASGSELSARANLTIGVLTGENSKYGVANSAGIGASVLEGKLNGGVTIFGVRIGAEAKGCLECAKAEYKYEIYYDNKAGRLRINIGGGLGLGVGAGLGGSLDIPIR